MDTTLKDVPPGQMPRLLKGPDAASARREFWLAVMCLPHRQAVVAAMQPLVLGNRNSVHAFVVDRLSPPIDERLADWDWRKLPRAPRRTVRPPPGEMISIPTKDGVVTVPRAAFEKRA